MSRGCVAHFGTARAKRMLMLAEMVDAEEARTCGFVEAIHPPEEIGRQSGGDVQAADRAARRSRMRAAKEAMRRLTMASIPDGADLIRALLRQRRFQGRHDRVPRQALGAVARRVTAPVR